MLLKSWSIYENYTGPLGVGTLTDIIHVHYGPGIESSENNGWGQWHRADDKGIGMDRTVATGTGFIGQYSPAGRPRLRIARNLPRRAAAVHAPRALHARAPLRQDGHPAHLRFTLRRRPRRRPAGPQLADAQRPHRRRALPTKCSPTSRTRPATRRSGATRSPTGSSARSASPTTRNASATIPNRIEAEAMELDGYEPKDVTPWETASGGQAAALTAKDQPRHDQPQVRRQARLVRPRRRLLRRKRRRLEVQALRRRPARRRVDRRRHAAPRPTQRPHLDAPQDRRASHSAPDDVIRLEATSDRGEQAVVDYHRDRAGGRIIHHYFLPSTSSTA